MCAAGQLGWQGKPGAGLNDEGAGNIRRLAPV